MSDPYDTPCWDPNLKVDHRHGSLDTTTAGQHYHLWSTHSDAGQGVSLKGNVPIQY